MTLQHKHNMDLWRDCISKWYPDYEAKTYFVPPVAITRIHFDVVTVAGQSVLVPQCNPAHTCGIQLSSTEFRSQRVQTSDSREDVALRQVLLCLRELANEQNEPMFVISHLQFSSYLGEPCYAAAATQFLRPQNLSKDNRRGDFDILIIHRHYGIITGEIKSVQSNQQVKLPQPDVDRAIIDRVRKAIKQLNKSEIVLREITKDLEPNLAIHKLLILPYVTADNLIRVVSSDEQLKQDLVTCLGTVDFEQALKCCLLAENIVSSGIQKAIEQQIWWSTIGAFKRENNMTSDVYLDLLARFCGPATTVSVYCPTSPRMEIRTEGQGVAVTGERMMSLVLTPEQISLLIRAPSKVLLTGPPGVGKSVMLVLMALTWLRQGHDVYLVSVWSPSLAATLMINHVIQVSIRDDNTTPSAVGSVHLHEYHFNNKETDVDKAIYTLTAAKGSHGPRVICDEFFANVSRIVRNHRFVTELCSRCPNVYLWAASPFHDQRPAELQEERMTIPLRCPPVVLSEVQKAVNQKNNAVHSYTTTTVVTPCDGPNVIHLSHQGPEHAGSWPLECVECGKSIADILQRLRLGVTDSVVNDNIGTVTTTVNRSINTANIDKTIACPPLQYRDVFVLTRSLDVHDDVMDEEGRVTSPANGVVRGLRAAGIPVRVIRKGHESADLYDTAVRQSDVVTVAHYVYMYGLERKVVVWLPGKIPVVDDDRTDELIEVNCNFHATSRCTSQLVVVDVPRV